MNRLFNHVSLSLRARRERRLLEKALLQSPDPLPPEGLKERLIAQLPAPEAAEKPGLRERIGMRKMLWAGISVTTMAVVAFLVALIWGYIQPEPVLARALRATEEARAVHTIWKVHRVGKEVGQLKRIEIWAESEKKYHKVITYTSGEDGGQHLKQIVVRNGDRKWEYNSADDKVYLVDGVISDDNNMVQLTINPAIALKQVLERVESKLVQVKEYDEKQSNGKVIHVVVMYEMLALSAQSQPIYRRLHFIDSSTNRLIGLKDQHLVEGQWRTEAEIETIEYDKPLPQELFTFNPSKGTKIEVSDWWKRRRYEKLAEGTLADWRLVIHSVDIARDGSVYVSLSRQYLKLKQHPVVNGGNPPHGRLFDEQGRPYAEHNCYHVAGEHWTLTFSPVRPRKPGKAFSQRFSIELNPYPPYKKRPSYTPWWEARPGRTVRIRNVPARPLPPELFSPNVHLDSPDIQRIMKDHQATRRLAIRLYKKQYGEKGG